MVAILIQTTKDGELIHIQSLKKKGGGSNGDQLRETPDIDLWPPPHVHMCVCTHTEDSSFLKKTRFIKLTLLQIPRSTISTNYQFKKQEGGTWDMVQYRVYQL